MAILRLNWSAPCQWTVLNYVGISAKGEGRHTDGQVRGSPLKFTGTQQGLGVAFDVHWHEHSGPGSKLITIISIELEPQSATHCPWAVLARVDRASGARGPLTLRLAGTPERWIEGKATNNRKAILCTGGFQPTDRISGWTPEREQTAQNGKCKLLDVR